MLLAQINQETAAEAVKNCIAVLPIGIVVSGSIGVAQYRRGETPGELIARADHALYRAKNAGRNKVDCGQCRVEQQPGE